MTARPVPDHDHGAVESAHRIAQRAVDDGWYFGAFRTGIDGSVMPMSMAEQIAYLTPLIAAQALEQFADALAEHWPNLVRNDPAFSMAAKTARYVALEYQVGRDPYRADALEGQGDQARHVVSSAAPCPACTATGASDHIHVQDRTTADDRNGGEG